MNGNGKFDYFIAHTRNNFSRVAGVIESYD